MMLSTVNLRHHQDYDPIQSKAENDPTVNPDNEVKSDPCFDGMIQSLGFQRNGTLHFHFNSERWQAYKNIVPVK